jgi:protein phosphatase
LLNIEDVLGKRLIHTRLHRNITIREENATTALEVMSRFAANPKWLIYLPPTMSPCATSKRDDLLEHPEEAFSYYFHEGRAQGCLRAKAHGIEGGRCGLPRGGYGAKTLWNPGR